MKPNLGFKGLDVNKTERVSMIWAWFPMGCEVILKALTCYGVGQIQHLVNGLNSATQILIEET